MVDSVGEGSRGSSGRIPSPVWKGTEVGNEEEVREWVTEPRAGRRDRDVRATYGLPSGTISDPHGSFSFGWYSRVPGLSGRVRTGYSDEVCHLDTSPPDGLDGVGYIQSSRWHFSSNF